MPQRGSVRLGQGFLVAALSSALPREDREHQSFAFFLHPASEGTPGTPWEGTEALCLSPAAKGRAGSSPELLPLSLEWSVPQPAENSGAGSQLHWKCSEGRSFHGDGELGGFIPGY